MTSKMIVPIKTMYFILFRALLLVWFGFLRQSLPVSQAGLELLADLMMSSACLCLLSAGLKDMCNHTRLRAFLKY